MTSVGVGEAKTHLSRLLKQVESGEEVIIERDGTPVARLVPMQSPTPRFGTMQGQFVVPANFDEPLPPEFQQFFE